MLDNSSEVGSDHARGRPRSGAVEDLPYSEEGKEVEQSEAGANEFD